MTTPSTLPQVPTNLPLLHANIPRAMAERPQWVLAQWSCREGKWTKIPINAATEAAADTTDPHTWSSLPPLLDYRDQYPMIGFVFQQPEDPEERARLGWICGVDLDACRNPETGEIAEWAQRIIRRFPTYWEISPSGTGVKGFLLGGLPDELPDGKVFWRNRKLPDEERIGPKTPGIEMYDNERFFVVTGQHLEGTLPHLAWLPDEFLSLQLEYAREYQPPPRVATAGTLVLDDHELLRRILSSRSGDAFRDLYDRGDTGRFADDKSAADFSLLTRLAWWTGDAGQLERIARTSALARDKWDEKRGPMTWLSYSIANAMKKQPCGYTPGRGEQVEHAPHPADTADLFPSTNGHGPPGDEKTKPRLQFPFITFGELRRLPPPKYQVEDFFLEQSLTQTYGETNHGKSLVRFDLSLNICQGRETWFGRKINIHGPVIWINADGGRGLTLRANAWADAHGGELKYPLHVLMGSVNLTSTELVRAFREQILAMDERPVLIEFDTQSRCMPGGRENDQDEMTKLTDGLHRLKNEVGCTVDLIHHADKTGRWERGSGVVKNESDTQILVSKDEGSGIFTVACKKGRDHPEFADFHFKLKPTLDSVIIVQHDQAPPRDPKEAKADHLHALTLLVLSQPGITYEDAAEEMMIGRKSVERCAEQLEKMHVLTRKQVPRPDGEGGRPPIGLFPNLTEADPRLCDSE